MFPESHGFDAVLIIMSNNFVSLQYLDRDKLEHVSMIRLVTGIATNPWLSGNMFTNIKTCENGWSNFSKNLRIVALKLLEFNAILIMKSINLLLFTLIFYGFGVRCDLRQFSALSPFIEKSMHYPISRAAGARCQVCTVIVLPNVHWGSQWCLFFTTNNNLT